MLLMLSCHVAGLASGASKDENDSGAVGAVAILEVGAGAAELANGRSRGGAAGEEGEDVAVLHLAEWGIWFGLGGVGVLGV